MLAVTTTFFKIAPLFFLFFFFSLDLAFELSQGDRVWKSHSSVSNCPGVPPTSAVMWMHSRELFSSSCHSWALPPPQLYTELYVTVRSVKWSLRPVAYVNDFTTKVLMPMYDNPTATKPVNRVNLKLVSWTMSVWKWQWRAIKFSS